MSCCLYILLSLFSDYLDQEGNFQQVCRNGQTRSKLSRLKLVFFKNLKSNRNRNSGLSFAVKFFFFKCTFVVALRRPAKFVPCYCFLLRYDYTCRQVHGIFLNKFWISRLFYSIIFMIYLWDFGWKRLIEMGNCDRLVFWMGNEP